MHLEANTHTYQLQRTSSSCTSYQSFIVLGTTVKYVFLFFKMLLLAYLLFSSQCPTVMSVVSFLLLAPSLVFWCWLDVWYKSVGSLTTLGNQ